MKAMNQSANKRTAKRSTILNIIMSCCLLMVGWFAALQVHYLFNFLVTTTPYIVDIKGHINDKTWNQVPEYDYSSMMLLLERNTIFFDKPRSPQEISEFSNLFKMEITHYYDYMATVNHYYHSNLPPRLKRAFKHYVKTLESAIHSLSRENERRSQKNNFQNDTQFRPEIRYLME
jgi:hypothetical protein